MVFRFYKNNSDNRKVNKDISIITVGSAHTKILDNNFIPRATGAVSTITCSSENSDYPAWGAFNSTINNSWDSPNNPPVYNECWLPTGEDTQPYIQIELSTPRIITNVSFVCGSDYAGDFTCNMIISASTDGINFDTLTTTEITALLNVGTLLNFTINSDTEYKYIRLSFDRTLANPYNPSMFICGINANSYHYEDIPTYDMNVIYKSNTDKDKPTLEIAYNADLYNNANYAYCVDTGYYYYLTEPNCADHRLYYSADVDLLMTYKTDIKKLGAIIARQENSFNTYLEDNRVAVFANKKVNAIKFPNGFSNTDNYILATNGLS